ncbi:MAG: hypothetical protein HeimC3_25950 [Candidatus Heimdallarchaeota archaeon LC_3]|nr:MAG: hypothetical protein HeimC3_25950 [Candidatus Heimdallarchaeota archaeon LC_3]
MIYNHKINFNKKLIIVVWLVFFSFSYTSFQIPIITNYVTTPLIVEDLEIKDSIIDSKNKQTHIQALASSTSYDSSEITGINNMVPVEGINLNNGTLKIIGDRIYQTNGFWNGTNNMTEYGLHGTVDLEWLITSTPNLLTMEGFYMVYDLLAGHVVYEDSTLITSYSNEEHIYEDDLDNELCTDDTFSVHTLTSSISHCGGELGDWNIKLNPKTGIISYVDIPYDAYSLKQQATFGTWRLSQYEDFFPLTGEYSDQYWFGMYVNATQVGIGDNLTENFLSITSINTVSFPEANPINSPKTDRKILISTVQRSLLNGRFNYTYTAEIDFATGLLLDYDYKYLYNSSSNAFTSSNRTFGVDLRESSVLDLEAPRWDNDISRNFSVPLNANLSKLTDDFSDNGRLYWFDVYVDDVLILSGNIEGWTGAITTLPSLSLGIHNVTTIIWDTQLNWNSRTRRITVTADPDIQFPQTLVAGVTFASPIFSGIYPFCSYYEIEEEYQCPELKIELYTDAGTQVDFRFNDTGYFHNESTLVLSYDYLLDYWTLSSSYYSDPISDSNTLYVDVSGKLYFNIRMSIVYYRLWPDGNYYRSIGDTIWEWNSPLFDILSNHDPSVTYTNLQEIIKGHTTNLTVEASDVENQKLKISTFYWRHRETGATGHLEFNNDQSKINSWYLTINTINWNIGQFDYSFTVTEPSFSTDKTNGYTEITGSFKIIEEMSSSAPVTSFPQTTSNPDSITSFETITKSETVTASTESFTVILIFASFISIFFHRRKLNNNKK